MSQRVLIVDDNVDTAESLKLIVECGGHEVRTAYDGLAALELADSFQPDAILLDVGLPRLDGFEVARRLRCRPQFAETLIVAASGYNRPQDKAEAREAGIDLYLVKPFDPWRLEEILNKGRLPAAVPA